MLVWMHARSHDARFCAVHAGGVLLCMGTREAPARPPFAQSLLRIRSGYAHLPEHEPAILEDTRIWKDRSHFTRAKTAHLRDCTEVQAPVSRPRPCTRSRTLGWTSLTLVAHTLLMHTLSVLKRTTGRRSQVLPDPFVRACAAQRTTHHLSPLSSPLVTPLLT